MTSRARITATARKDLRSIYRFIAVDRQSPDTADRQIEFLFDKFAFLAHNPLMGELRDDLRPGLRLFSAGSYVIFYRPVSGGISITRVIHGRRNWKNVFEYHLKKRRARKGAPNLALTPGSDRYDRSNQHLPGSLIVPHHLRNKLRLFSPLCPRVNLRTDNARIHSRLPDFGPEIRLALAKS